MIITTGFRVIWFGVVVCLCIGIFDVFFGIGASASSSFSHSRHATATATGYTFIKLRHSSAFGRPPPVAILALNLPTLDGHTMLDKNCSRRSMGLATECFWRFPNPVNIEPLIIISLWICCEIPPPKKRCIPSGGSDRGAYHPASSSNLDIRTPCFSSIRSFTFRFLVSP